MGKKKKVIIISLSSILGVLVILTSIFFIYVSFYYHVEDYIITGFVATKEVTVTEIGDKTLEIKGKDESNKAGIIFYPGGKVEYTAYEPILASIAEHGYTCILPHMTFNLAVLSPNKADGYITKYPKIKTWYMAGHSLGGVVASTYAYKHLDSFTGLINLASYPNDDISSTELKMLNIYGSEDKVLEREKYNASKSKWPEDTTEYVIEGGNHAYFGMYGKQKGDGEATITNEKQVELATNKILEFLA